ncbi:MAG: DNA polymerase III subunit gamma/tau, partial [Negativicutes bacterium]|nr:DNA polymerase III subunit gamma/tau [Negativicutes bacterium]
MSKGEQELIGNHRQRAVLLARAGRGELPSAMLISGPQSVGKARLALVLAAAQLCRSPGAGGPCGACQSCRAVGRRTHPDLMVIAAENGREISLSSVRELACRLAMRGGALGDRQVLVIDDGDRLSELAANYLLKTVEEPGDGLYLSLIHI